MSTNGMERVWHGSHRKPSERNWFLHFSLMLFVVVVVLAAYLPH